MTKRNLGYLLAVLLPAGPVGFSTALALPAEAVVEAPVSRESGDVAARLANIQNAVAQVALDPAATEQVDPNIQKVWWENHGWGRPGRWGWGNGGWHNGGWGDWHPWGNG
jgi:rSAM-associated Gly-rich repeat protein